MFPSNLPDSDSGDDEPEICPGCNGSGEGYRDGTTCLTCGGSGEIPKTYCNGDPDEYDPD